MEHADLPIVHAAPTLFLCFFCFGVLFFLFAEILMDLEALKFHYLAISEFYSG
jgi:hypothetical protein